MTTYLEDFNRTFIGTTAPNGETYVNNGGWSIDSNQGLSPADPSWNTLIYEHGLTDPTIEVTPVATDIDDYWGIIVRYTDTNNWIVATIENTTNYVSMFRREAGFDYTISGDGVGPYAGLAFWNIGVPGPYPLKVYVVGDDFLVYANDVYVGTGTSSFLSGSTYAGIGAYNASLFDNFSIYTEDVVPPEEPITTSTDGGWGFIPLI
jgi:hypothetical protein